jgi:uncharacterized membrane protein
MGALFQSLGRTITAGVVLLVIFIVLAGLGTGSWVRASDHAWWAFVFRWLHVLSGVMWIGLLWYFNFVQTPSMPKIPDEQKPAVSKVIAPTALFWFRWGAMATIVTGLIVALMNGYLGQALSLQKALGMVTVTPEEKAKAARMAGMTSRLNTMLSIPMLYCMVAQQNGGL